MQTFAVQDCLPLRVAPLPAFGRRGVGRVEIKERGVTIDPEKFSTRAETPRRSRQATVLLTRIGKRQVAIIAERVGGAAGVNERRFTG